MENMAVFAIVEGFNGILLVHDKDKPPPAMWKLPGGKVEKEESPEIALYRELKEEIGINIMPLEAKDVVFEKNMDTHIFRVYKVRYYNSEVIRCQKEIEWLRIFSIKEIKQMLAGRQILPKHAMALTIYLRFDSPVQG